MTVIGRSFQAVISLTANPTVMYLVLAMAIEMNHHITFLENRFLQTGQNKAWLQYEYAYYDNAGGWTEQMFSHRQCTETYFSV